MYNTTKVSNLVSRILFLHYHLSAINITVYLWLPTLARVPPLSGIEDEQSSNEPIRGITAPKVYPCYASLQNIVSSYLTFSPIAATDRMIRNKAVIFCGTICMQLLVLSLTMTSRLFTGGLLCAVRTFLHPLKRKTIVRV